MYNGVINICKEKGFTSHDVVAKLRGILKQKKIGHTGTLDPDAEGVLPVCLGKGTKLCDMITDKDKTYKVVLIFGAFTDTEDISGEITSKMDISEIRNKITDEQIISTVMSFVGEYKQIPPMYSAIKINGKKLYELARAGQVVERKPRLVNIINIENVKVDYPRIHMEVTCSKGTYIRSLLRDICEKLQVCGCMEELTRTRVSQFELKDSLKLSQVEALVSNNTINQYIMPIDEVFGKYKVRSVKNEFSKILYNGNSLMVDMFNEKEALSIGEYIKVYDSMNCFIGIYRYETDEKVYNQIKLIKMFYDQTKE